MIQPIDEEDHIEDTNKGYGLGVGADGKRLLTQQEYDALPPEKKKEIPWKERPENIDRKPYIHAAGELAAKIEEEEKDDFDLLPIKIDGFKSKIKMYDYNVMAICEMIMKGKSYVYITNKFNASLGSFNHWRANSIHADKVDAAIAYSADYYADKGEKILMEGIKNGTENMAEAQLRRSLADYYKWKAKVKNPKGYGDKVQTDVNVNVRRSLNDNQFSQLMEKIEAKATNMIAPVQDDEDKEYTTFEEIS